MYRFGQTKLQIVIIYKQMHASWWFQAIWKNIRQIGSFPTIGMKQNMKY